VRFIYRFGNRKADGSAQLRDILGGKGANLAEMTNIGLPVPPGFTIATKVCRYYLRHQTMPKGLVSEVKAGLRFIERVVGRRFGDGARPLLVSVRSGAKVSMPGMMDTVLNLGLNDVTVQGLARLTRNERFAWDAYRRFIQMYADVVLGTGTAEFESLLKEERDGCGARSDAELPAEVMKRVVARFQKKVKELTGQEFPADPEVQLWGAIEAVLKSWNTPRAVEFRYLRNIPHTMGTAVNIQAMVFGNLGAGSATGVAFTRDPATGENRVEGEYLDNAQGEDIVAGIRTPKPLEWLRHEQGAVYEELLQLCRKLERHYRNMQDVEFTIEQGRLWILQCRTGERTPKAAVRIAFEMVQERLISQKEAVLRVDPRSVVALVHKQIAPGAKYSVAAQGIAASPGAASGQIALSAARVVELKQRAEKTAVILVRPETSADDVAGMARADGFLTATGGTTSHAAVVARGMGKPCVVGCAALRIDGADRKLFIGDQQLSEGDIITINGTEGEVIIGPVAMVEPELDRDFLTILSWADRYRRLAVRANADTPEDAAQARSFGATGIGLCRTEHMFFAPDRIGVMQEMIMAEDEAGRRRALDRLLPMQREDFCRIFRAMDGYPVTIRTLDPPLHEFLPKTSAETEKLAQRLGVSLDHVTKVVDRLREANPMLGFRGCRLGIIHPEITEMQARAVFEAACQVKKEGVRVYPEVMIPLVSDVREFRLQRRLVQRVAEEVFGRTGVRVDYLVGTMIEVPRAAILAAEIAKEADFFSFGTNDLTQLTFGFSRDDADRFLSRYEELGIVDRNPFDTLDRAGVGYLVRLGKRLGRRANKRLKVGICGEHGGDPDSVIFCHNAGLDYVSCSTYRVLGARLAAAHAALLEAGSK